MGVRMCLVLGSAVVVTTVMVMWIVVLKAGDAEEATPEEALPVPPSFLALQQYEGPSTSVDKVDKTLSRLKAEFRTEVNSKVRNSPYHMIPVITEKHTTKKEDKVLDAPNKAAAIKTPAPSLKSQYFSFPTGTKKKQMHATAHNPHLKVKKSIHSISNMLRSWSTEKKQHAHTTTHNSHLKVKTPAKPSLKSKKQHAHTKTAHNSHQKGKRHGTEKIQRSKLQVVERRKHKAAAKSKLVVTKGFGRYVEHMQDKLKHEKQKTKKALLKNHRKIDALAKQYRKKIARQKRKMMRIEERSKKEVAQVHAAAIHLAKQIHASVLAKAKQQVKAKQKGLHTEKTTETQIPVSQGIQYSPQNIMQSYKSELKTATSAAKEMEEEAERLRKKADLLNESAHSTSTQPKRKQSRKHQRKFSKLLEVGLQNVAHEVAAKKIHMKLQAKKDSKKKKKEMKLIQWMMDFY